MRILSTPNQTKIQPIIAIGGTRTLDLDMYGESDLRFITLGGFEKSLMTVFYLFASFVVEGSVDFGARFAS